LKPHVLSIMMSRMGKFIFRIGSIKIVKVNADSDLSVLFKNRHNISDLVWVLFLSNEATFDEFMKSDFDPSIMPGRNRRCCCLTSLVSGLILR